MSKGRNNEVSRVSLCALAGLIMAINVQTFVHTGGLLPGGFAGVALLFQNIAKTFWGVKLSYGTLYFFLNLIPIIISYKKIGKKFTIFSCVTIMLNAFLTDVIPYKIITYDILLISIFGGIINGFAVSLCLIAGATSGGTDFIAIYISEKFGVDAFNYVLGFNACVLICDGLLFGWSKALYSILFQYASTQVIHIMYKRYQKNTLLIVTDKPKEVAGLISNMTGHGATDIHAFGSYENTPRSMLYSVISREETAQVISEVKKIDTCAFINVIKTENVYGKFWMRPND
ncbi:MAG: YitT family protein [Lachnospiraceae bacterium]|nr:YitT family protein [Lachnospiraceae bacterium]